MRGRMSWEERARVADMADCLLDMRDERPGVVEMARNDLYATMETAAAVWSHERAGRLRDVAERYARLLAAKGGN